VKLLEAEAQLGLDQPVERTLVYALGVLQHRVGLAS
jgi:hypothetical protein